MTNVAIRVAKKEDAAVLLAIYEPYVKETTITFEYEVPTLADFCQRIETTLTRFPYLVAETPTGEIIGYAYAGSYKGRAAYDWSVETTVYVKKNCIIKGVGTQLYEALEEVLKKQHVINLLACITAGNERSVKFHEKLGYQVIGTFPQLGFKFNQWCDVIWMQKTLHLPKQPKPFIPFSELNEVR